MGINFIGLLLVICLALVHIFASRTQWLKIIPQKWWISIAGGIAIAYIFLDIFPELEKAQMAVEMGNLFFIQYIMEDHVYLLALVGLGIFYGLENLALRSRTHRHKTQGEDHTPLGVFWLHTGSFAVYNVILGYLLRESENHGLNACLLLFLALALHFLVNDISLREHHKQRYDRIGRWLLAGAIILGWTLGQVLHINEAAIAVIWALMAGGIILNVLKEELPEQKENHFGMFVLGATVYSGIFLMS